MNEAGQKAEAILFLAGEAVARDELQRLLACSSEELTVILEDVAHSLADHGLTLLVTPTHAQLVTSPDVAEFVANFVQTETEALSAAAAETLSIIAYRGPIERSEIDVIRGVDSRRMVRQLLARGLIRKNVSTKRNSTYAITEEFLQFMGLRSREELPRFAELSSPEKINELLARQE